MSFEGAVIVVSHDRYFVDKITNKLWAFENGNIDQIYVPYSEYLEYEDEIKELDEMEAEFASKKPETAKKEKTQSAKLSYKQSKILEEYPALIEALEIRIKELNKALSTPEIYQEVGIQTLFEELEEKKGDLYNMENEYYEVLSIAENLK